MQLPLFQIDAFAEQSFQGNPAAVVPLQNWLPDHTLQAIASENNLSETAFFIPVDNGAYHIRWFTPNREVKLCGHATLATAYVLFHCLGHAAGDIVFRSLSGQLTVSRAQNLLTLDFPAQIPEPCAIPAALIDGLGIEPTACLRNEDFIAIFDREEDIAAIAPDFHALEQLDLRGVLVTAAAAQYDFVTRFFAPKYGIPEDPVTGSAYTQAAPYWAGVMGKTVLKARQLSARGGDVLCELKGDRVAISGTAVKYLEGRITV